MKASTYKRFKAIERRLDSITSLLEGIMANLDDLKQNMVDLRALADQLLDLIKTKDDTNAALVQQIKDLVAQHVTDQATLDALNAGIDAAVSDSQATEDKLRAVIPGVPPVGGTPLATTYADRASFDAAVAAYTGPERVTIDGADAKAGTDPSLDYFTHSADGHIDNVGPTD